MVLSRRFAQVWGDDEDDLPITGSKGRNSASPEESLGERRKRKNVKVYVDEEEKESERKRKRKGKKEEEDMEDEETPPKEEGEDEEEKPDEASPIGDPVKVTGKGKGRRTHFLQFEYDGNKYDLGESVLLVPEEKSQKPYVAIIKDITQTKDGSMMILGQWFYHPEEAEKKDDGNWQSSDTRELFYSFHRDVYDTVEKKLWKLTDKDYEDTEQHEINLLVEKTKLRLADLPDVSDFMAQTLSPEDEKS